MAIFLTSIDILDTGFLKVGERTPADRGSNQGAAATRVNAGAALRLKGVTLTLSSSANLDKSASPGRFNVNESSTPTTTEGVQCPAISSNPTEFTLTLYLNSKNDSTSNVWGINDMALLNDLLNLPHTPWFKALYYPVDNAATGDTRGLTKQMVYYIGSADTTQNQGDIDITLWNGSASATGYDLTDVNYIACRFESVKLSQSPKNNIQVDLSGVITT